MLRGSAISALSAVLLVTGSLAAQAECAHVVEYVTSTVSVLEDDGVVIHTLNHSGTPVCVRVRIFTNTGAGASEVTDSGDVQVSATWGWGLAYQIPESGEYWVSIRTSSEYLVPQAFFERIVGPTWSPVVSYLPGDFAVFKLPPAKRLW